MPGKSLLLLYYRPLGGFIQNTAFTTFYRNGLFHRA